MIRKLFLLTAFIVSASLPVTAQQPGQPLPEGENKSIGIIEFFAYKGADLDKVRAALPFKEGDPFPPLDTLFEILAKTKTAVRQATGRAATDIAPVCCDKKGNWMFFIGLGSAGDKPLTLNETPTGDQHLPDEALKLYQDTMEALSTAVQKGAGAEDDSKGYALSEDPALRALQLKARDYAIKNEQLLIDVLSNSAVVKNRIAASQFLGYANQSPKQLAALVRATHDRDDNVRNNAIRALIVIARANRDVVSQIPAEPFVEMLNSGNWTDRNKAGGLLMELSASRKPATLDALRTGALNSLTEMARWKSAEHAYFARVLLGRIGGLSDPQIEEAIKQGRIQELIDRANSKR